MVALAAIAAALLVGTAWAGTSAQAKIITFTASYAGKANVKVTDNVADISASGAGKGTLIGASTVKGIGQGDASQQPCVPWGGKGTMANTKGSKINFEIVNGSGCGDEEGQVFSITGRAKVLSGTKLFKKAKGLLKVTGTYNRGAGTFAVKFSGKLTV
jgi:hypothetical protein